MVKWSFLSSEFSLNFLDLTFVLVIVFLLGSLVAQCLVVWGFHFPKLVFHLDGLFLFVNI